MNHFQFHTFHSQFNTCIYIIGDYSSTSMFTPDSDNLLNLTIGKLFGSQCFSAPEGRTCRRLLLLLCVQCCSIFVYSGI